MSTPTQAAIRHFLDHDRVFRDNWNTVTVNATPVVQLNVRKRLIRSAFHRNNLTVEDFSRHTAPALPNHINL